MVARSYLMNFSDESLASWASILGTLISFLGLIQSRAWLTAIGIFFIGASLIAIAYARRERRVVTSAMVQVEGRSIDSLNIANLRRRVNRSLMIQEAHQVARIEGEDLKITWQYTGYCRARRETAIEFSIDSDNGIPFDSLDCVAYDLRCDPERKHKIRPILIGTDGLSKKIAVPFLEPLTVQQPFTILLKCALPGCMKAGLDYYTSTLSFDQDRVRYLTVRLIFVNNRPQWVRLYQCAASGSAKLLKDLRPFLQDQYLTEYLDVAKDVAAQSARIYVFRRATLLGRKRLG
jgi:hypothetical protein